MSIVDQLSRMSGSRAGGPPVHGLNRAGMTLAKVTNVTDPDNKNRVKCLPIIGDDDEETDWCRVMAPLGGPRCGAFWMPRVDDLVVLGYLDDDPHRPLVLGAAWTPEIPPPYQVADGQVQDYAIRTPSQIELHMHDEPDKHKTTLTMPSGTVLTLDDEAQQIQLQDKDGKNALRMDLTGGAVTLQADTTLTFKAGETSITLEKSGNITLKGSGTISLEGTNIEIKASAQLNEQGQTVAVKSGTTLDLSASGPASLKGALVKIN